MKAKLIHAAWIVICSTLAVLAVTLIAVTWFACLQLWMIMISSLR